MSDLKTAIIAQCNYTMLQELLAKVNFLLEQHGLMESDELHDHMLHCNFEVLDLTSIEKSAIIVRERKDAPLREDGAMPTIDFNCKTVLHWLYVQARKEQNKRDSNYRSILCKFSSWAKYDSPNQLEESVLAVNSWDNYLLI